MVQMDNKLICRLYSVYFLCSLYVCTHVSVCCFLCFYGLMPEISTFIHSFIHSLHFDNLVATFCFEFLHNCDTFLLINNDYYSAVRFMFASDIVVYPTALRFYCNHVHFSRGNLQTYLLTYLLTYSSLSTDQCSYLF